MCFPIISTPPCPTNFNSIVLGTGFTIESPTKKIFFLNKLTAPQSQRWWFIWCRLKTIILTFENSSVPFSEESKRKSHCRTVWLRPGDDAFKMTRPWENQQDFNLLFYIQTIGSYSTFSNELWQGIIIDFHRNHLDTYMFYTNMHIFIPGNLPP